MSWYRFISGAKAKKNKPETESGLIHSPIGSIQERIRSLEHRGEQNLFKELKIEKKVVLN